MNTNSLMQYIAEDTKGFPPTPGALLKIVNKMEENDDVPALLPACRLVRRAIRHGPEYAEEEFEALSPGVQAIIGSTETLGTLASLNKSQQEESVSRLTERIKDAYMQSGTVVFPANPLRKHVEKALSEIQT